MMRPLARLIFALGAIAPLLAGHARAQGPGMGLGMMGGPYVLMAPNVRSELKLTDEQAAKVPNAVREVMEKQRDGLTDLRDAPQEERARKFREILKAANDEVKGVLKFTPEQSKRFDQISIQQRGLQAFGDPEIQATLKLTDDQKGKVRELGAEARDKMQQIFRDSANDREGAIAKLASLRKELREKAVALLDDDQKKAWSELAGPPFDAKFEGPPNN